AKMKLNSVELYEFLKRKRYNYFYHANSVTTACTFIEQKGLLSRGDVELNGLVQTEQSSDGVDKTFDVWDDIFLDIVDLHQYFSRQNHYGPVCFVMDIELLLDPEFSNIWITKDNPINWDEDNLIFDDNYYSSLQEYTDEFAANIANKSIQKKMFTIRKPHKELFFEKYLVKIILDNPEVEVGGINLYDEAKTKIENSLNSSGFNINLLKTRSCPSCYCRCNYLKEVEPRSLKKLFL
ncbi:MAG: hypothetical protein ACRC76_11130, partial [Proteocatella sp.]